MIEPAADEITAESEGEMVGEPRAPVAKALVATPTVMATYSIEEMPYPATNVMEQPEEISEPEADKQGERIDVGKRAIRVVEVGLAFIAIAAGIAAFVLRRGTIG